MSDMSNFSNATNWTDGADTSPQKYPLIKVIHDWLIVGILVSIMFGMGCHVKLAELWAHLRRPFGVAVGMLCQFVMMPLLAFGLLTAMRLNGLYAIGMLIMACCPGGTVSNVFAYFVDGDVPLSIAMTLCSTVLAMGMMPVNMLLYGHYVDTGDIVVPYSKMAMSLVFISLPAGLGMLFNWLCPRLAPYVTKEQKQALLFPWLYGFTMIGLSFILCGAYAIYKKFCARSSSHNISAEAEATKGNEKMQLSAVQVPSNGMLNPAFQS